MKQMKKLITSSILVCGALFFVISKAAFWDKAEPVDKSAKKVQVLILGGGCAGLTAANYLSMAGYKPVVLEGPNPGGLITQSEAVRNWPGEVEIAGENIAEKLRTQAKTNGADILKEKAISVDFHSTPYKIVSGSVVNPKNSQTILANSVIIAMGTQSNYLNVPGESQYWGKGVSNCATCDGNFYKNKVVAVIGGGDGAIVEASYLLNLVKKLYLIVRADKLRAIDKRKNDVTSNPKVEVLYNNSVQEIIGSGNKIKSVRIINNKTKETGEVALDGVFLAIGSKPNSEIFHGKLHLDNDNYIIVGKNHETSKKGIFAVGDIVDRKYKQAITAAGHGAEGALEAIDFLEKNYKKPTINEEEKIVKEEEKIIEEVDKLESKVMQQELVAITHKGVSELEKASEFEKELHKGDMPIVLDFYAHWCRPCMMMHAVFDQLAEEFSGKIKFLRIDFDKFPSLAEKYGVKGIPNFIFISKDGEVQNQISGLQEFLTLENASKELLN